MGIQGLLPFLSGIQQHTHLREFAGKTVGVDGYVWLHRGAYSCATELVTGNPTTKYVEWAMQRVRLMQHHHVMPYVVFDGGPLPAKLGTEEKRQQQREANLSTANSLAAQGHHSQARDMYVKCVDVTPQMAYQLIKALRAANVPYIVAPYEADAQLAYLERQGLIDAILTEDSDLLVFGARQALFKLDSSGTCVSVCRSDFGSPALHPNTLVGWGDDQFRWMAMLAGCDYLDSIPGMGLKTAHKLLRKYRTVEKVLQVVRFEGKCRVPRDYLDNFRIAELAFLHQRVYDPTTERLVHFTPPPEGDWDEAKHAFVGTCVVLYLRRRYADPSAQGHGARPGAPYSPRPRVPNQPWTDGRH
ncbi:PIN domain-like protein [Auricularia subglabra TFB-10046 SS5]|nr:PIN domain-like protein [Auricularia subglabra TFB-10046 SS5]